MDEELKSKLMELGLSEEQTQKLQDEGVQHMTDMALLSPDEVKDLTGCGIVTAKKIVLAFVPVVSPVANEEIPEGKTPTPNQVSSFASQIGMDANMLMMVLLGNFSGNTGSDMDLSGMMPIPAIAGGYNPKIRDISYLVMGQLEKRLGTPIVVINPDGSVNTDLMVKYIMALEEGFDPAPDSIYYDDTGAPFEIIKVGVDAQSIYDADPLDPTRALQKNGMGIGRVNWNNVPLDVRQTVYYAATQTGEVNPADDAKLQWLRTNIKPTSNRLNLRGEFPNALAKYNEAARTGSLPTLRVQLSRQPRRPEVMPRRRARNETLGDESPQHY